MSSQGSLSNTKVLIIDCQATGPHPEKSHLLEIGWGKLRLTDTGPDDEFDIRTMRISIPEGIKVPAAVQRITGISSSALAEGIAQSEVWDILEADTVTERNSGRERIPTIIHFARYEEPYLRFLHHASQVKEPFPFQIFCTWEISRRLLPHLPRRGLRAIAGYLGHSVPELRRSYHHIKATASVWRTCVEMLAEEQGIVTFDHLQTWLEQPIKRRPTRKVYPMDSDLRLKLPERPGVYRMLRSNGDILYVGKATSLKSRVNSYFQKQTHHPDHILEMLTQAQNLTVSPTASALEAALLESDEIKILSPPYNIALRTGDRSVVFLSRDLSSVRSVPDAIHCLGPFPSLKPFDSYANVSRILERRELDQSELYPPDFLGFSEAQLPEDAIFRAGLQFFVDQYQPMMCRPPRNRGIERITSHLWQELLRRRETESKASGEEEEKKEKVPWEWTPERVSRALENVLLRGSHLKRRSVWLCRLSESTISWRSRGKRTGRFHLIRIESGQLVDRSSVESGTSIPVPAGGNKLTLQRQCNFDIQTYDRLCVLTTELKRLVTQEREVTVWLSSSRKLGSTRLARILRWL